MTFDINLKEVDLLTVKPKDVKTFRDVSLLFSKIRFQIDKTENLDLVYKYCDLMLFIYQNFSVSKKHFNYIKEKSDIDFASKDYASHILEYYHNKSQNIRKNGHVFYAEFEMRPLETIFRSEDTLELRWFKSKYTDEATFHKLIEKLWYFVEFTNNSLSIAV